MKRYILKRAGAVLICLLVLGGAGASAAALPEKLVPAGITAGISLETKGVMVVGFTENSPARNAGIAEGDCILYIDETAVSSVSELTQALTSCAEEVKVKIERAGNEQSISVAPDRSGASPKLGIFVRDSMAGIGTVTYYDPATLSYGALGHGISELHTGKLLASSGGKLIACTPDEIIQGQKGTPGELSGQLDPDRVHGSIEENTPHGIFGHLAAPLGGKALPVGTLSELKPGEAEILSGAGGSVRRYAVRICAVYRSDGDGRDMLIEVTDPELIALTGGIVRGMSGSPLVQNGKLVGAVTHVLVSDPLRGYGISMENMLSACRGTAETADTAA